MTEAGPRWKDEAEDAIRRLPGVIGARIRMQGDEVSAVFVQTDGSRDPRRFVRDVEAVLAVVAGIDLDFRKVSVAAVRPESGAAPAAEGKRLAFENVSLRTSGLATEASVELSLGGARVVGVLSGPATRGSALELVAGACLQAATQLIKTPVSFSLGGLERMRLGRDRVVVVVVRFVQGRTERVLTGSSPSDPGDVRAAAYATLDAINRAFAGLQVREPIEYIVRGEEAQAQVGSS